MKLPRPLRCSSQIDGDRCDLPRFHGSRHVHRRAPGVSHYWSTDSTKRETYETDAPWITWTWLSTDRETRFTGRMRHKLTCCICGKTEIVRTPIPRWGPVPKPEGGIHPMRVAAIERHSHPGQRNRADWALPLRNPVGGLDLGIFQRVAETAVMEHAEQSMGHCCFAGCTPCPGCGHCFKDPLGHSVAHQVWEDKRRAD